MVHLMNDITTEQCSAARTGEGYWTCDQHGCSDCRSLARDIEDWDQLAEWATERALAQPGAKWTPETGWTDEPVS